MWNFKWHIRKYVYSKMRWRSLCGWVLKLWLDTRNRNIWTIYLRHYVPFQSFDSVYIGLALSSVVQCNSTLFQLMYKFVWLLLVLYLIADPNVAHASNKWCRQCFEWNYREMNVSDTTPKEGASFETWFLTYNDVCSWLRFVEAHKKNSSQENSVWRVKKNTPFEVWTQAYHMLDITHLTYCVCMVFCVCIAASFNYSLLHFEWKWIFRWLEVLKG